MKKLVFAMMALVAMSFASCDGGMLRTPDSEKNVNMLFEQAQKTPSIIKECNNPEYQQMLAEGTDCVSCKALCLLYIREYCSSWDDTMGEIPEADRLTEDASSVLDYAAAKRWLDKDSTSNNLE